MADLKISQLTGATTPLAGTEVLPIVQSGSTVKVAVSDLTAGRAVAMAGGSFTDNITQSTAAKGVNFTANTPAAGMTSQLLNWYEEGTFTTTWTGLTGTPANTTLYYTRIGRCVNFSYSTGTSTISGTAGSLGFTVPFAPGYVSTSSQFQDTAASQQQCIIFTNSKVYVRTFNAVADSVVFSGFYFV